MQFVTGQPFDEAVDKLGAKSLIASKLRSDEWSDVPVALRERAFFSSRVESVRFLQRARDGIADFLQSSRETLPSGETALKDGSRAAFVDQMKTFLAAEGVDRTTGGLTDITSERRLGLIFDTQTRQANDYGYWRQGQDPDVLDEFPAQRFIRVADVKEPRTSHTQFEDQVYLKNDPIWAERINEDFGVPWGPWAWGCGHDVEDVDRAESEALGLIAPGQQVQPDEKSFNENLQASTRGLDPDLLAKLQDPESGLGNQLVIDGDVMYWSPRTPAGPSRRRQFEIEHPLPAAVAKAEAELAQRVGSEKAIALDAKGNVILEKAGGKSAVGFTVAEAAKLKDAVFTHNHPRGVSFSNHDIRSAAIANMAELRAVGVGMPYTYSLQRPAAGWPPGMAQRHLEIQDRVLRELVKQVNAGQKDLATADLEVAHETMLRLAKELGLKYERTQRA